MMCESSAQTVSSSDAAQDGVVLVKLSEPVYPKLTRVARITGDVNVMLGIRPDGSIESVEIVSG